MAPVYSCLFSTLLLSTLVSAQSGSGFGVIRYVDGDHSNEGFGQSVSAAGDINRDGYGDYLIGAPSASPNGVSGAGKAYLYSGKNHKLLAEMVGEEQGQSLGSVMAPAGDINADGYPDIVMGCPNQIVAGFTKVGAVYVYSGKDGQLLRKLTGSFASHRFGCSVSTAGDVNADGFDDFIIGSYSSYAYVYSGASNQMLYALTGQYWNLGVCVAGGGDLNGDGFDDVAISHATGDSDDSGEPDGVAYVFSGADGSQMYMFTDQGTSDEHFGTSLAFAGDVNGDGYEDVIIGANGDQDGFGGGLIQVRSGKTGGMIARILGQDKYQAFGVMVSAAGDWDKDGYDDFAVGSSYMWSNYPGIVELYSGRTKTRMARLSPPGDPGLGYSMDYLGDITGDGYPNCIVAMPKRNAPKHYGSAALLGLGPVLELNRDKISIFEGGSIGMKLEFPKAAANMEYKILMSAHGTGPTSYGVDIPLTQDAVMQRSANGIYPVESHVNMHGTLDGKGSALARLDFPPDIPTSMLGTTLWLAAVAHPVGELPQYSSVARTITLVLY